MTQSGRQPGTNANSRHLPSVTAPHDWRMQCCTGDTNWFISLASVGHNNAWRYYLSYKRLEAYLCLKIPLNGMTKAIFCCAFPVPLQACVILPYTSFFLKEHQFIFFYLAVLGVGLNMISDDISLIQSKNIFIYYYFYLVI